MLIYDLEDDDKTKVKHSELNDDLIKALKGEPIILNYTYVNHIENWCLYNFEYSNQEEELQFNITSLTKLLIEESWTAYI